MIKHIKNKKIHKPGFASYSELDLLNDLFFNSFFNKEEELNKEPQSLIYYEMDENASLVPVSDSSKQRIEVTDRVTSVDRKISFHADKLIREIASETRLKDLLISAINKLYDRYPNSVPNINHLLLILKEMISSSDNVDKILLDIIVSGLNKFVDKYSEYNTKGPRHA